MPLAPLHIPLHLADALTARIGALQLRVLAAAGPDPTKISPHCDPLCGPSDMLFNWAGVLQWYLLIFGVITILTGLGLVRVAERRGRFHEDNAILTNGVVRVGGLLLAVGFIAAFIKTFA